MVDLLFATCHCGWLMQADDAIEAEVLLGIHETVWLEEALQNGTPHTKAARDEWLAK